MLLIGLSGKMGVGKSTALNILKDDFFPLNVQVVKFAQPLYDMQEMIYRRISAVHPRPSAFIKDRVLLQWLGTDWGRGMISEDIWVDLWKHEALTLLNKGAIVVCDDVRYDNEAELIKNLGGFTIQLTSNTTDSRIDTSSGIVNHKSEAGIDSRLVDRVISNDGTVEQLRNSLREFCIEFMPAEVSRLLSTGKATY